MSPKKNEETDKVKTVKDLAKELSAEELLFCEEYLRTHDIRGALEFARINSDDPASYQIFANPTLQEYLNARRGQLKHTFITEDDLLCRSIKLLESCVAPEIVVDGKGHPLGSKVRDTKTAKAVLEMLFKYKGMLANDGDKDATAPVPQNVNLVIDKKDLEAFEKKFNKEF